LIGARWIAHSLYSILYLTFWSQKIGDAAKKHAIDMVDGDDLSIYLESR